MLSLTVTSTFASIFLKYVNPVSIIFVIFVEFGVTYLYLPLKQYQRHQLVAALTIVIHYQITLLKRVHHCLARVVLRAPRISASLPLLKQLHWLPVSYRINFKLSTLTYRALSTQQPPYLTSLMHLSNIPRQLRSSISQQFIVPKTKLNLCKRAFSIAAPRVWNELPVTLKTS